MSLTFDGDPRLGKEPWTSGGGGVQAANYGTPSKNNRLRGNVYFLPDFEGIPAIQCECPPCAPGTVLPDGSTATLAVCDIGNGDKVFVDMLEEFIGIAIWVPPAGMVIPNAIGRTNISEYAFTYPNAGAGQPSLSINLFDSYVEAFVNCGPWLSGTNQQHYEFGGWNLPPMKVAPALAAGKWNSFVFHAIWTTSNKGLIESWYRSQGGSWTKSPFMYSGKPSVNWVGTPSPKMFANGIMNYGRIFTSDFSVYHAGEFHGTDFASVAGRLP